MKPRVGSQLISKVSKEFVRLIGFNPKPMKQWNNRVLLVLQWASYSDQEPWQELVQGYNQPRKYNNATIISNSHDNQQQRRQDPSFLKLTTLVRGLINNKEGREKESLPLGFKKQGWWIYNLQTSNHKCQPNLFSFPKEHQGMREGEEKRENMKHNKKEAQKGFKPGQGMPCGCAAAKRNRRGALALPVPILRVQAPSKGTFVWAPHPLQGYGTPDCYLANPMSAREAQAYGPPFNPSHKGEHTHACSTTRVQKRTQWTRSRQLR